MKNKIQNEQKTGILLKSAPTPAVQRRIITKWDATLN